MKLSIAKNVHLVEPHDFEPGEHWYPRALNSNIHPLVGYFLNLSHEQLAERYCRLVPQANPDFVRELLSYQPTYFRWAGTDLMHVTNKEGHRKLTVIETNSCPSGQKSMPLLDLNVEQGGYRRLIEKTFKPMVEGWQEEGALAVIYDKNPMENVGYAATVADVFGEEVYLAQFINGDKNAPVKWEEGKMFVNTGHGWKPIRAAFRYVTQEPWNRLPKNPKTLLLNPIEACLAGGRNKEVASVAYDNFNARFKDKGMEIFTPATVKNVSVSQLPDLFFQMGGSLVVKVPDSNAGQGVMTVTNENELKVSMEKLRSYDKGNLLVQQLIHCNPGANLNDVNNNCWYHVGTIPDSKGRSYAFDVRLMLHATEEGLRPLAAYSRRARQPLNQPLPEGMDSWEIYGTNLSIKNGDGWSYDDVRLVLFDVRNFGSLGLGIDELIKGFFQSCMAVYSVDQHAIKMFQKQPQGSLVTAL